MSSQISIWSCLVGLCFASFVFSQEATTSAPDHEELAELFKTDQKVRSGFLNVTPEQLAEMLKDDPLRRARVADLYDSGSLSTANDYYHAAMIFQHGEKPDEFLFAHELAVASLALGNQNARWLVAATEDRFLKSLGRKQRFGTQFGKDNNDTNWKLHDMDAGVNDDLRAVMNCPSSADITILMQQLNDGKLPTPSD